MLEGTNTNRYAIQNIYQNIKKFYLRPNQSF